MISTPRRGAHRMRALARWCVSMVLALSATGACGPSGATSSAKEGSMSDVHKLDELLGAQVLAGRPGVQVRVHRPSPQLPLYEAYARFDGDEFAFRALMSALGLGAAGTATAGGHLPAAWRASDRVPLPWWDATAETPATAAARPFGSGGWIVAKLERGHVYLIVTDTGVPQP